MKVRMGKTTHGMTKTSEFRIWCGMRWRCESPKHKFYSYYGGRGIKVCDRWQDFVNFYQDMGARPEGTSLDRINPDGNYEPGNCRWATWSEQMKNRKGWKWADTTNHRSKIKDRTLHKNS